MKVPSCLAVATCLAFIATTVVSGQTTTEQTWNFEDDQVGATPGEWTAGVTGAMKGTAPRWEVIYDDGRQVLGQLEPGGARGGFPVCLRQGSSIQDGTVSVRFKSISGQVDQAGGVVFHAKDKVNLYIARANALENNVSFYVTVDGNRKTIKYWNDIEVELGMWHELRVEAQGSTCPLNRGSARS